MQSLWRSFRGVRNVNSSNIMHFKSSGVYQASRQEFATIFFTCERETTGNFSQQSTGCKKDHAFGLPIKYHSWKFPTLGNNLHNRRELRPSQSRISQFAIAGDNSPRRCITTGHPEASFGEESSAASPELSQPQRIKFKRLSKTAKHIMNILDKEAVDKVQADREIPDIRPGYIIQLKVEVPENKRRVSTLKGIVIARRNAGLNTTFRLRRLVAGVGIESVFPLYSPNIKEVKVLDKRRVRRAKLYYLRDRMNPLKK